MVQRPDSCTRADGFQSLSGFLMSCNRNDPHLVGSVSQFQSLSGFLMSCNGAGEGIPAGRTGRFQSLSGFLMSCNRQPQERRGIVDLVSIPIGFSNEL